MSENNTTIATNSYTTSISNHWNVYDEIAKNIQWKQIRGCVPRFIYEVAMIYPTSDQKAERLVG